MCDEADKCRENEAKEEVVKEGNRKSKRSLKLLRGNERDLKLDVEAALNYAEKSERLMPYTPNNMKVIFFFSFIIYLFLTIFLLLLKSIC